MFAGCGVRVRSRGTVEGRGERMTDDGGSHAVRVDLKHRWMLLCAPFLCCSPQRGRKSGVWPYASFPFALAKVSC